MTQLILTEEQAQVVRRASEKTVQVYDPSGKLIGEIAPEWNQDFLAELKRRADSKGPWLTGAQVQARLKALQKEWEDMGGFDAEHMREFLARLDQSDPGRLRQENRAS